MALPRVLAATAPESSCWVTYFYSSNGSIEVIGLSEDEFTVSDDDWYMLDARTVVDPQGVKITLDPRTDHVDF